jgi:imidazolonepropionase-like amidohydrolase
MSRLLQHPGVWVAVCAVALVGLVWTSRPTPVGSPTPTPRTAAAAPASTLIRGARVFDGERVWPAADVRLADGRIAAIAESLPAQPGETVVEGGGHTLLPGLIDSHVHAMGSAREDALRFGVTTVLDLFGDPAQLPVARAERESLAPTLKADLWGAGFLATAAGGHGTQFGLPVPTLSSAAEAPAWVAARKAEGSDVIKLVREDLSVYRPQGPRLPTLDPAITAAVIAAVREQGLAPLVHVSTLADGIEVLRDGAQGLVHLPMDAGDEAALIEAARASGAFIVPTLAVIASFSGRDIGLAEDARLAESLSGTQRQQLKVRPNFSPVAALRLEALLARVGRLQAAGIPILAGSDAPNPGTTQGASLHGELALLVEAGLTPVDALKSATALPAAQLKLADRGRIAAGLRADLLLVEGDPTVDITATRARVAVWKNGAPVVLAAPVETLGGRMPAGLLADFDQPPLSERWMPAADTMMGGRSSARVVALEGGADGTAGALLVEVDLAAQGPDGMPPWAGVYHHPGPTPMAPVNASGLTTLRFHVQAEQDLWLVIFSGDGQPQRVAVPADAAAGGTWRPVTLDLGSVPGYRADALKGLSWSTSTPAGGTARFALDQVELR